MVDKATIGKVLRSKQRSRYYQERDFRAFQRPENLSQLWDKSKAGLQRNLERRTLSAAGLLGRATFQARRAEPHEKRRVFNEVVLQNVFGNFGLVGETLSNSLSNRYGLGTAYGAMSPEEEFERIRTNFQSVMQDFQTVNQNFSTQRENIQKIWGEVDVVDREIKRVSQQLDEVQQTVDFVREDFMTSLEQLRREIEGRSEFDPYRREKPEAAAASTTTGAAAGDTFAEDATEVGAGAAAAALLLRGKSGIRTVAKHWKTLGLPAAAFGAYHVIQEIRSLKPSQFKSRDEYRERIAAIISQAVARFGLTWVSAMAGAFVAGALTGGLGTIAGLIVGGISGFAANYFLGDDVDTIVERIVDYMWENESSGTDSVPFPSIKTSPHPRPEQKPGVVPWAKDGKMEPKAWKKRKDTAPPVIDVRPEQITPKKRKGGGHPWGDGRDSSSLQPDTDPAIAEEDTSDGLLSRIASSLSPVSTASASERDPYSITENMFTGPENESGPGSGVGRVPADVRGRGRSSIPSSSRGSYSSSSRESSSRRKIGTSREPKGGTANLEDLEGKSRLQAQVYNAFKNAGFSHRQALSLSAEVGRENSFRPHLIFGAHRDPHNGEVNVGLFSWQKKRGEKLLKRLSDMGLVREDGGLVRSQETLDAMAKFAKWEMETDPRYRETKEKFLANPDIDPEEGAVVLGDNYIRWRRTDPKYAHHNRYRRQFYSQVEEVVGRQGLVDREESRRSGTILGRDPEDQFGYRGKGSPKGVDKDLMDLFERTAEDFPLRVRFLSGKEGRASGAHSRGMAGDITIYDENGNPIPNYQNSRGFRVYEMFAQLMRHKAKKHYPYLADDDYSNTELKWGGMFGDNQRRPGTFKYGSMDLMDFRILSSNKMRAGDIESGLQGKYKGWYDKKDMFGGSKPFESIEQLEKDMERLRDFRMSPEQFEQVKEDGFFGVAKASGRLQPRKQIVLPTDEENYPPHETVEKPASVQTSPSPKKRRGGGHPWGDGRVSRSPQPEPEPEPEESPRPHDKTPKMVTEEREPTPSEAKAAAKGEKASEESTDKPTDSSPARSSSSRDEPSRSRSASVETPQTFRPPHHPETEPEGPGHGGYGSYSRCFV